MIKNISTIPTDVLRERVRLSLGSSQMHLSLYFKNGFEENQRLYKVNLGFYLEEKAELNRRAEEEECKRMMDAAQAVIENLSPIMVCTRLDGTTYEVNKPTNYRTGLYK